MALGDPGGTGTGSYSQASPEKHRVSVRLHMCPSRTCSYVWVHVPCPCVCVHLMCPSSVCISCPCVFGNRHSSACACISVHTPGPVFTSVLVHLDQPLFPCAANVLVHLWVCTHTPVLVRVMWTEHLRRNWQPFSGKAKRSNNFGFAGHVVSVTTTQLSHCSEKAATD